jgi:hypothetical protein
MHSNRAKLNELSEDEPTGKIVSLKLEESTDHSLDRAPIYGGRDEAGTASDITRLAVRPLSLVVVSFHPVEKSPSFGSTS